MKRNDEGEIMNLKDKAKKLQHALEKSRNRVWKEEDNHAKKSKILRESALLLNIKMDKFLREIVEKTGWYYIGKRQCKRNSPIGSCIMSISFGVGCVYCGIDDLTSEELLKRKMERKKDVRSRKKKS